MQIRTSHDGVSALALRAICALMLLPALLPGRTAGQEPSGEVLPYAQVHHLESRRLDERRRVLVRLPASYERTRRAYPVLVVLDAETQFEHTVGLVHFLARDGRIPEMVVVESPTRSGHATSRRRRTPSRTSSPPPAATPSAARTRMPLNPDVVRALQDNASTLPSDTPRLGDVITGIVPPNVVAAAADGAMLPLLVFAVLFAAALTRIDPERREIALGFFHAVADASMQIVRWVIAAAPVGVFALTAAMVAVTDRALLGALGYYVVALCLTAVFFTIALYLLPLLSRRLSLRAFTSAVAPAQGVAFGSRSSLASLPAMIDGVRRNIAAAPEAPTFVLPFAASTFKFASPFNSVLGVLFVSHLYGIELAPGHLPMLVVASVLLSFAVPGVPGGSFSTLPLFLAAGLPPESIGLLIAVDALPDSFRTVANATADVAVASVLTASGGEARRGAVPAPTPRVPPNYQADTPAVASVAPGGTLSGREADADSEPHLE